MPELKNGIVGFFQQNIPKEHAMGIRIEMVKTSSSRGPREGAAVPTCEECGKRPWTDWRPNFQKYLCTECNTKHESRTVRFERRGRRNHPVTVGSFVDEEF
jgi:hypothetical protein